MKNTRLKKMHSSYGKNDPNSMFSRIHHHGDSTQIEDCSTEAGFKASQYFNNPMHNR